MYALLPVLKECKLFRQLPEQVIQQSILPQGRLCRFPKQTVIIEAQEYVDRLGVVTEGRIKIMQLYTDGLVSLTDTLRPPFLLGADLICTGSRRAPYQASAVSDASVFFLPAPVILEPGFLPETERLNLWRRLLTIISDENIRKYYRMAILSQRSLRGRVLTYLTMQAGRLGTNSFQIPFTREEMADFLCVNRSKLSHELSLMQKEGLIQFRKNAFTLLAAGEGLSTWKVSE